MKYKIVIDDKIPFIKGALEPFAEVIYCPGKEFTAELVKDADALIIRTRTKCNAELLAGSSVKLIASATIGFDHIDRDYCDAQGIKWTNAPGCNAGSVQQYIGSVISHLAKKYKFEPCEKCLGVVGVGNVGTKVASLGRALGMNVLLNDPPRQQAENSSEFVDLKILLEFADIITIHTPLNIGGEFNTEYLFDRKVIRDLAEMGREVFIINTARGEVVHNPGLKRVMKKHANLHAVLDVWEYEPIIDKTLARKIDLSTSHIAGYSADGKANGTMQSVTSVAEFFGFDIGDWSPEIPVDEPLEITLDDGKSAVENLCDVLEKIYPIEAESELLKSNLDAFEELRGNYKIRRELKNYKIHSANSVMLNEFKQLASLASN